MTLEKKEEERLILKKNYLLQDIKAILSIVTTTVGSPVQ